jgi:hypothetical protein
MEELIQFETKFIFTLLGYHSHYWPRAMSDC